jgi:hypothetical protein
MKKTFVLTAALIIGFAAKAVFAQTNPAAAAPAVSIVDITSVIYPAAMPTGGGPITFTYKVTNPGKASLNNVSVTDDYCSDMSGELGDTNGNHLLDPAETWIYTCAAVVTRKTTHSAMVTAYADGVKATDSETATVDVPGSGAVPIPTLPKNGSNPGTLNVTALIWGILGGMLVVLIIIYLVITRKKK